MDEIEPPLKKLNVNFLFKRARTPIDEENEITVVRHGTMDDGMGIINTIGISDNSGFATCKTRKSSIACLQIDGLENRRKRKGIGGGILPSTLVIGTDCSSKSQIRDICEEAQTKIEGYGTHEKTPGDDRIDGIEWIMNVNGLFRNCKVKASRANRLVERQHVINWNAIQSLIMAWIAKVRNWYMISPDQRDDCYAIDKMCQMIHINRYTILSDQCNYCYAANTFGTNATQDGRM